MANEEEGRPGGGPPTWLVRALEAQIGQDPTFGL
jgi:hypothetical protein